MGLHNLMSFVVLEGGGGLIAGWFIFFRATLFFYFFCDQFQLFFLPHHVGYCPSILALSKWRCLFPGEPIFSLSEQCYRQLFSTQQCLFPSSSSHLLKVPFHAHSCSSFSLFLLYIGDKTTLTTLGLQVHIPLGAVMTG